MGRRTARRVTASARHDTSRLLKPGCPRGGRDFGTGETIFFCAQANNNSPVRMLVISGGDHGIG